MSKSPTLTVGVTGHRPNRLHIGEAEVGRRLRLVLAALRFGARGRGRIAVSALAEGSDRLFAGAALDLGYVLRVLLPFSSGDYEKTFSNTAEIPQYRALLTRASSVTELPGSLFDSKAAYEAVGRATITASNILVAVWDGKGAAGRGGTPELIEDATAQAMPVIWINAARLNPPRLLEQPSGTRPSAIALDVLKSRAKTLTRADLMSLACLAGSRRTS